MSLSHIRIHTSRLLASCLFFCFLVLTAQRGIASGDIHFIETLKNSPSFTVAVLPMENMSVNGEAAYHFRMRLCEQLRAKGYNVVENHFIDEKLYNSGVQHAGQLGLLSFDKIKQIIPADGYLSGIVEQAATQHGGVINSYVYTCSLKLQDYEGQLLWSSLQERIAKRRFAIDPINMLVDVALTEGAADADEAVAALADRMLEKLPQGPTVVLQEASLLDMAVEIEAKTK